MPQHTVYISPNHMDPSYQLERDGLGPDVDLKPWSATNPDDLAVEISDADAVMTWRVPLSAQVIDRLTRCQVIIRFGVGFDIVDVEAARARDIPVCNIPDYCTDEVADHTMGLLLALNRQIVTFSNNVRSGNAGWSWAGAGELHRITGSTLGVIGLGRIGTAVALRAKAFGMDVAFHDPYVPDGTEGALDLRRLERDELLASADYVTLHTPLTNETRGMADREFFSKLKLGATLINTSRGPVVDIEALEAAMRNGDVRAAGLDVLPKEPPEPEPGLLTAWRANEPWLQGRLIVTPHSAFYNEESDHDMRVKAARTVREVFDGLPARNRVNP
jgi:phosphoglycerate dehydrogenase-like enzyme